MLDVCMPFFLCRQVVKLPGIMGGRVTPELASKPSTAQGGAYVSDEGDETVGACLVFVSWACEPQLCVVYGVAWG
jgi:hypothetical protein